MSHLHEARMKLRAEIEAPPALRRFGSGWISGVLGFVLAVAGFLFVLSLRAPGLFSMTELRPLHENVYLRGGLHVLLILAFGLSALSLALRDGKILGTCGVVITLLAVLLGGSRSTQLVPDPTPIFFGLDWFVLNVLFTGMLFIPIERLFPRNAEQPIFREEWREDLFYYLVSSMMVQVLTALAFVPAKTIFALTPMAGFRHWVAALPFLVQLVAIMFLTDLVQYWLHRSFHRVPWLWNFHAVHHSARAMDWMAGARMHFLEIIVLRGITVIPMIVLGFSETAMHAYILLVYLYSTFIHANVGWRLNAIEPVLVTPRFHHWHHGIEREAVDVNFAIHFPLLDRLFGTHHLPGDKWPAGYGIAGHPVPHGYVAQFQHPFKRQPQGNAASESLGGRNSVA
jgi:sterol desaturase/sphingolipid hydroxylase (fatty acid hydroxylase superfamily)